MTPAIELLKNNKKLNIHSESTNYSNYKVWISKSTINASNIEAMKKFDNVMKKLKKQKNNKVIIYYVDGKKVSHSYLDKLKPNNIKATTISKDGKTAYITLK